VLVTTSSFLITIIVHHSPTVVIFIFQLHISHLHYTAQSSDSPYRKLVRHRNLNRGLKHSEVGDNCCVIQTICMSEVKRFENMLREGVDHVDNRTSCRGLQLTVFQVDLVTECGLEQVVRNVNMSQTGRVTTLRLHLYYPFFSFYHSHSFLLFEGMSLRRVVPAFVWLRRGLAQMMYL